MTDCCPCRRSNDLQRRMANSSRQANQVQPRAVQTEGEIDTKCAHQTPTDAAYGDTYVFTVAGAVSQPSPWCDHPKRFGPQIVQAREATPSVKRNQPH